MCFTDTHSLKVQNRGGGHSLKVQNRGGGDGGGGRGAGDDAGGNLLMATLPCINSVRHDVRITRIIEMYNLPGSDYSENCILRPPLRARDQQNMVLIHRWSLYTGSIS